MICVHFTQILLDSHVGELEIKHSCQSDVAVFRKYAIEFAALILDTPSAIAISVSLAVKDEFCSR